MAEIIKELKLRKANGEETSAEIMASYLGTEGNNYTYTDIKNLLENNKGTIAYGTCSSAASSSTKVIILEDENTKLKNNTIFCIKFTYTNSVIKPKFQITGATYPIVVYGQQITASSMTQYGGLAGSTLQYLFRDDIFIWIGGIDRDTDTNTDTKVKQNISTNKAEYPILISNTANATSTETNEVQFAAGIVIDPSSNTIKCYDDNSYTSISPYNIFIQGEVDELSVRASSIGGPFELYPPKYGMLLDSDLVICDSSQKEQSWFTPSGGIAAKNFILNTGTGSMLVSDHVVAEGTNDYWRWRKWSSGKAECWGSSPAFSATVSAWGSLYAADEVVASMPYPVEFTSIPVVVPWILKTSTSDFWLFTGTDAYGTAKESPSFGIARATTGTCSGYIHMYVIGNWK